MKLSCCPEEYLYDSVRAIFKIHRRPDEFDSFLESGYYLDRTLSNRRRRDGNTLGDILDIRGSYHHLFVFWRRKQYCHSLYRQFHQKKSAACSRARVYSERRGFFLVLPLCDRMGQAFFSRHDHCRDCFSCNLHHRHPAPSQIPSSQNCYWAALMPPTSGWLMA